MTGTNGSQAELFAALAVAQGAFPPITRDRTVRVKTKDGGSYTFAYAPLDSVMEKVRPVLAANGLAITQTFRGYELVTSLIHASGGSLDSVLPMERQGGSWQEFGSAITYARRYAIVAILGLASEEDDDANRSSGNTAEPVVAKPKADKPDPVAGARRRMHALFKEAGINDRADRLIYTNTLIGREISTSTEMTASEVDTVCASLTAAVERAGLPSGQGEGVGGPAEATSDAGPASPYTEQRETVGPTQAQYGRLDELVPQMMEASTVTISDLWVQLAVYRKQLPEQVIAELGGRSKNGVLQWAPLKAALTRSEAGDLIDHLQMIQREGGLDPDQIPF